MQTVLLHDKEYNQNIKCSLKRNWMKLCIGLNVLFRNPSDALHRISEFQNYEHEVL